MDTDKLKLLIEKAKESGDTRLMQLALEYLQSPLMQFRPRPDDPANYDQQSSFYHDRFDGIAVCRGGNGSGKSFCGAAKTANLLLNSEPPIPMCPFWVVSQNLDTAAGVDWGQHLSRFIPDNAIENVIWLHKNKGYPKSVILKPAKNGNNFVIEFKSVDQERKRLQGSEIFGAWIDEQIPMACLVEIYARCRRYSPPGAFFYTLTPLDYDDQLEQIAAEPEKYPQWKTYRMNSACNDRIKAGFMEQLLATELEERRQTRMIGEFATFHGQIFKNFDPAIHVVEPFDLPHDWRKIRALDVGWSHSTAMIYVAQATDDTYYAYAEYYQKQKSLQEHVDAINAFMPWDYTDHYTGSTFCDWQDMQVFHELQLCGLSVTMAAKGPGSVYAGIGYIQQLLRVNDETGKPRLFIFKTCEQLIKEMRSYQWDKGSDKPLKVMDDAVDALRYCLFSDRSTTIKFVPKGYERKKRSILGVA